MKRLLIDAENPNGIYIDLTSDEIAQKEKQQKAWEDGAFDRALENLRLKRNKLLFDTDWWASSDLSITDEQKKYRQDLRDLTNGLTTVEQVEAVEFPTKPS